MSDTHVTVTVRPKKNQTGPWTVHLAITSDVGLDSVTFRFHQGDRGPELVGGSLDRSEAIVPSDLQRFAWSRWTTVALAALRRDLQGRSHLPLSEGEALGRAVTGAMGGTGAPGRPGPKPRDPAFFHSIAEEYSQLVADGESAPTKKLAERRGYNRSTMAGFVRRARALGFLPEPTHGRAG